MCAPETTKRCISPNFKLKVLACMFGRLFPQAKAWLIGWFKLSMQCSCSEKDTEKLLQIGFHGRSFVILI